MQYFARSIDLADSTLRHVYVYAVALDSGGNTDEAMRVIEAASRRWPNQLDLYFLQVSYMDKTGNTKGIHRYLSVLASVAAGAPQVGAWMRKYGGG